MRKWLHEYLQEKYKGAEVITIDSHARTLDSYLEEYGIIDKYPQTVGLDIQIDVLGIVKSKRQTDIVFIEAKKTQQHVN
jgi:predicted O-methyltransferase YrrM